MLLPLSSVVDAFAPVGLDRVQQAAALQDRVDTKYVILLDQFEALAECLRPTHAVLEIDGRRAFRYRSTYFDTPQLHAFREHMQRRRRRFKCRTREYLDSGLCTFEVKLKGRRGRTVKHRMPYDSVSRDELTEPAIAFLRACVERSYGRSPRDDLHAMLDVHYTRLTLVAPELGERVTCDFDLAFTARDGSVGRLAADRVIVESKSPRGSAVADRELRALGARPQSACSKYCLGVGCTNPQVANNPLRPLLRRHFCAGPAGERPAAAFAARTAQSAM